MNSDDYAPPAEWFDRWWDPRALLADALARRDEIPGSVPGYILFKNPALKPLREAYAAAKFAMIRGNGALFQVRLVDPARQYPDFEIRIGEVIEPFELVEADRQPRRRVDEYREANRRAICGLPPLSELYDPDEEMTAALPAIKTVLDLKRKKHYRPAPHILVYVNFSTDDGRPPLRDFEALELGNQFGENFPSIWLLWGENAVRCWPNPANIPQRA